MSIRTCMPFRLALGLAAMCAVLAMSMSRGAHAENLPEVEMDQGGPKQMIPLGKEFVLTGKIKPDTTQVQAVFVRYAFYPFGAGSSRNVCRDIADGFTALRHDKGVEVAAVFTKLRGLNRAEDVWQEPNDVDGKALYEKYKGKRVYLPSPWERPEGEDKLEDDKKTLSFRIIVGAEPIFRPGSHTCLFLFQRHVIEKKDTTAIPEQLTEFRKEFGDCKIDDECRKNAQAKLVNGLTKLTNSQKKETRDKLAGLVRRSYYDAAEKLVDFSELLLLDRVPHPEEPKTFGANQFISVASDPGRAVAELLAFNNKLQLVTQTEKVGDKKKLVRSYYTNDSKVQVKHWALQAGGKSFAVAFDPAQAGKRSNIEASLEDLKIPESTLNLKALVELSKGRVLFKGEFVEIDKLSLRLRGEGTDAPASAMRALSEWLSVYHAFLKREANGSPLYADLRTWYGAYDGAKLADLQDVVDGLLEWARAVETLQDTGPLVTLVKHERVEVRKTGQRPLSVSLDQKAFVTNFITPVVGRSLVLGRSEDGDGKISATYLGVQIFLAPNPIDEPMWSNGFTVDAARLVGLELGVSLKADDFGNDDRVTSVTKQFPAMFAGLALQPFPYVSASFGASLFGVRRTTLTQEKIKMQIAPYFGVSVQANIPDLIRALSTTSGATPQAADGGKDK